MRGGSPDMKPSTNSAEIEAAAATWFAKRESGGWSAADQVQLEAWLDSATAHRIAFIRIVTAWERSGRLTALGAGVPAGTIPPRDAWGFAPAVVSPTSRPPHDFAEGETGAGSIDAPTVVTNSRVRTPPRFAQRMRAVAAAVVIGTTASAVWYFSTDHASSYSTRIGALSTVPLSDGSKITLNTDSEIHVALQPTLRRVKLDQGEVFFDVSKDATRPFVVDVADKRVTAVGTQFSVRRDHEDIRVFVAEGRVSIESRDDSSKGARIQVPAGSEARTSETRVLVEQPAPAQVEQLLSWRTGHIIFRDTALADAVADFNRYSTRKIVIEDPAIAGIRIGGNFRSGDVDAFLWLLHNGFPINVEQRGNRIVLTRR